MTETLETVLNWVIKIAAAGGALAVIWGWIVKPIRKIDGKLQNVESEGEKHQKELSAMTASVGSIRDDIERVDEKVEITRKLSEDALKDTGDLLGDRLEQAYDYYVLKKKWIPSGKKKQLNEIYRRYHDEMHRNHLAEHWLGDIMALPEEEP